MVSSSTSYERKDFPASTYRKKTKRTLNDFRCKQTHLLESVVVPTQVRYPNLSLGVYRSEVDSNQTVRLSLFVVFTLQEGLVLTKLRMERI